MKKKFIYNFIVSFLVFIGVSAIGLLVYFLIFGGRVFSRDMPTWLVNLLGFGISAILTGTSAVLFFYNGRKLNALGKHWLNYLSVSGSLIIPIILELLGLLGIVEGEIWIFIANLPFIMLMGAIEFAFIRTGDGGYSIVLAFIMAALPSIVTCLGMRYQSKKAVSSELNLEENE